MKRVRIHIFILLILLCGALMLGNVALAKYQTETAKPLSAAIHSRWTPAVSTGSWTTTIDGAEREFTIQNPTSSEKTVVIRVLISEQEGAHSDKLCIKTTDGGTVSKTDLAMHHMSDMGSTLQKTYGSSGYIYCADASGKETTWTISPGDTLEGAIIDSELNATAEILVSQPG